jgi:hypothetical protein
MTSGACAECAAGGISTIVSTSLKSVCSRLSDCRDMPISVLMTLEIQDASGFRKTAIRYWERRRIVYNAALIPPAFFGYIVCAGVSAGVGDRRFLGLGSVIGLFVVSAVGANICYSFAYVLEFLIGSKGSNSWWLRWGRTTLLILGILLGMFLALLGGRDIANFEYHV